jgi:hypothetical protein
LTNGAEKRKQRDMTQAGSGRLPAQKAAETDRRTCGWAPICREKLLATFRPPSADPKFWPAFMAALFISLVFLTLPTAPPDLGIDVAWSAVLNWAHERGLQFGKDVVFTYGPLGFLLAPYYFGRSTGSLVFANAALCFQVALGLCLVARRLGWIWRCALVGVFVLESASVEPRADLALEVGFFCWGLLCVIESGCRRRFCAASFVILACFAALTKVTYVFAGGFSLCAIALYLWASGERPLGWVTLLAFAIALPLGWLACGQDLAYLGSFLLDGFLISRDYDQAFGMEGLPMLRLEALLLASIGLAAVLLWTLNAFEPTIRHVRWRRAILTGWVSGLLFLVWKHSMVRVDRTHTIDLLVFTPVVTLALAALPGSRPKLRRVACGLAIACCLVSFGILESAFVPGFRSAFLQPFRQFSFHVECLLSPMDWRRGIEPESEERRREAELPKLSRFLGNASVDVFGSLQAHALLNGLNYRPRPIFQSYAAYGSRLAQLNEKFYLSQEAPDYVLFDLSAFEHKFPTLNDGPALRALLANYEPVAAEEVFLLLKRRSASQPKLALLREGTFMAGERLSLSSYSEDDLWLELDVKQSLLGRLATFLVRPAPLRLSVWTEKTTGPARLARRRVAPSLLTVGFVASPCLLNTEAVRDLYTAERVVRPSAYSIEPDPGSERFWEPTIRFRIYKIENRLGRCVPPELRPMLELKTRGPTGGTNPSP